MKARAPSRSAVELATMLNLVPAARSAWLASIDVWRGSSEPSATRCALAEAIRARAPRLAFVAQLWTQGGPVWSAVVGCPAYDALDRALGACPWKSHLPPHLPFHMEAGTGPYSRGRHLVMLLTRAEPPAVAAAGPPVSFEILNAWQVRLTRAFAMLRSHADSEVCTVLSRLEEAEAQRDAVVRSIVCHECGHMTPMWPFWPKEPEWIRRARDRDGLRVIVDAFGDLAADVFGPWSGELDVQLVTMAYQLDNLRRGTAHDDADHLGASLLWAAVMPTMPSSDPWLTRRGLSEGFETVRAHVARAAAQIRESQFDPDTIAPYLLQRPRSLLLASGTHRGPDSLATLSLQPALGSELKTFLEMPT